MKNTLTSFYLRQYKDTVPKGDTNIHEAIDLLLHYMGDTLDEPIDVPLEKLAFDIKDDYAMDWEKDKIEDQISYLFQKYGQTFNDEQHFYFGHDDDMIQDLIKLNFIKKDPQSEWNYEDGDYLYFNKSLIQYHIFKKARMMLMDNMTYYYDNVLEMLKHFDSLELIDCKGDCIDKLEELSGNLPL